MKIKKHDSDKIDPLEYEMEIQSRHDEILLINSAVDIASQLLDTLSSSNVLDFCCGTGFPLQRIIRHKNVSFTVGVDISDEYLTFARNRFRLYSKRTLFIQGDAITVPIPNNAWDLITLFSAYHHIEDERKLKLLQRVRSLLKETGYVVIAENILPKYEVGNLSSYNLSVKLFYDEVLREAIKYDPKISDSRLDSIRKYSECDSNKKNEFKVDLDVIKSHLKQANLKFLKEIRVWPHNCLLSEKGGGNYVFVARCS